uniref:Uncharacterized protein n=1 Tax=Paramormyrops kingsleyae TaxID=1676925 RepID=A0A3B3RB62_9TELE
MKYEGLLGRFLPLLSSVWGVCQLCLFSLLLVLSLRVCWALLKYWRNARRLRCFALPRKRNWLLGHLGLVSDRLQADRSLGAARIQDTPTWQ